ncbi:MULTISPECIES: hypothetical protein [unclassified Streptomyces]|uniref:hypothetical protein n=1 Tax=unclassified Streptomyces TaxID=2593676 RepID=UPI002E2B8833|nr:hypothetical protein [Streptomyces sp. NBC_00223]
MVATAAQEVDDLHSDLIRTAQATIDLLEPLRQGKAPQIRGSYGVLGAAGPRIERLATRRGAAYEHLARAVSAYRRLLPETAVEAASAGLGRNRKQTTGQAPGHDDDWAVAGDRQTRALRAVEQGGLLLKQSALPEQDRYLSGGSGVTVPVWVQTVERMLADGLLEADTSTTPIQGQLLSLTPLGLEALRAADDVAARAARAQDPRAAAALSRSARSTRPFSPADTPAAEAGATGQAKPTRTR